MNNLNNIFLKIILAIALACSGTAAFGQTASFIYQGKLADNNVAATGTYQMQFGLFDAASGGSQIGASQTNAAVTVTNGTFAVNLGFGVAAFDGSDRYLEVSVFSTATNAFVTLTPRQQITSAPYSVKSLNATTADSATNALNLGGTAADQFVVNADPRMTDARPPTPGSGSYIQNGNALQEASSFNISGNGNAGGLLSAPIVVANTQYNIGFNRVLSAGGANNLFAGVGAGSNTTGIRNAFFGSLAGTATTTGSANSFFGALAGFSNTIGTGNSFYGLFAGEGNTTGNENSFFGLGTGDSNTTGIRNSFVGASAGAENTTGGNNSFFGRTAGTANTTGGNNTFIGAQSNSSVGDLNYAAAIGSGAVVSASNTIVLGRSLGQDTVKVPGILDAGLQYNIGGSRFLSVAGTNNTFAGIGTGTANSTGTSNSFVGRNAGIANTTGYNNSFFGAFAGDSNTEGIYNSFYGVVAGEANTVGSRNSFFGRSAGENNTEGLNNAFFGYEAGKANATGDYNTYIGFSTGSLSPNGNRNTAIGADADVANSSLSFATAIGAGSLVSQSNTIALGRPSGSDRVYVYGGLALGTLAAGSATSLCIDGATSQIAACSSSIRYKTNVSTFNPGLSFVNRLRPVTFDWKESHEKDLGLIAEEVAEIEPLLVTRNKDGEIQGVKYDRISIVLLNAVREQQTQIQKQQEQIEMLKQLVCQINEQASVCKEK
jgi:hypothetical protein